MSQDFINIIDTAGRVLRSVPTGMQMSDSAYHGASRTAGDVIGWNPFAGSADADLIPEMGIMNPRSRDLVRNHGIAQSGEQTQLDNIVGTGLRLAASPDALLLGWEKERAVEWSKITEAKWRAYSNSNYFDVAEQHNFPQATRLVFRSGFHNGDALALPMWLSRRGRKWRTCFQLVESDRLSNPMGKPDSQSLRGGVEINKHGAPRRYWVKKSHPGDWFFGGLGLNDWEGIPAYTSWGRRRVIHVFEAKRIGQHRGVTALAASLKRFKSLDKYELAELNVAAKSALIAGFITSPMGSEELATLFGSPDKYVNEWTKYNKENSVYVDPNSAKMIPLFPGESIEAFNPGRPNQAYESFISNVLKHLAASLNMPYELLAKDFSNTNYSSARAALMEAWRFFKGAREWLANCWAQPVYELWLEEAVNNGEIEAPGFYKNKEAYCRARWIGPGRGSVDPKKEGEGNTINLGNLTTTLQNLCADTDGSDWEDVVDQRVLEVQTVYQKFKTAGFNDEVALQMAGVNIGKVTVSKDQPENSDEQ